jgi:hypothetical protein
MVITILMKVLAQGRALWGNSLLSSARIPNSVQAAASTAVGVGMHDIDGISLGGGMAPDSK